MQNVISDPVFGLPEKGFQKENVKDIPSGMLIWSISEGMFLKNEFQSQPNENSFDRDWKIIRLINDSNCQSAVEKTGFRREKARRSQAGFSLFSSFTNYLTLFSERESDAKCQCIPAKAETDTLVMAEVSG